MINHYKEYTNREIELISRLTQEGVTQPEIAKATGRTHEAVKAAVKRFKLSKQEGKPRAYSEFEKAIILSPDSPKIIGSILGLSGERVSGIRFRLKRVKA